MKKLLLIAALAASFAMGQAAEVESFQQLSKATITSPTGSNARQGIGFGDKFYINDKSQGVINVLNVDGTSAGTLNVVDGEASGLWPAICKDEAGNVIARCDASWPSNITLDDANFFRIFPADGGEPIDLAMPLAFADNTTVLNGRIDYFGAASGDVVNGDGALYLTTNKASGNAIFKVAFSNGEIDEDNSMEIAVSGATIAGGTDVAINAWTAANGEEHVLFYNRSYNPVDLVFDGTQFAATQFSLNNRGTLAGGVVEFSLGDEDFVLYNLKSGTYSDEISYSHTSYADGFRIVAKDDVSTILAEDKGTGISTYNGGAAVMWVNVDKVSEYEAKIYVYYPGNYVASYQFKLTEPAPATRELTGSVFDSSNNPLEGVTVTAVPVAESNGSKRRAPGEGDSYTTTTAADGSYTLEVPADTQFNLTFEKEGYQSVTLPEGQAETVTMQVATGIEGVTTAKTVARVRFVNAAGQVSATPFNGFNMEVTTYTDGTSNVVKVIK